MNALSYRRAVSALRQSALGATWSASSENVEASGLATCVQTIHRPRAGPLLSEALEEYCEEQVKAGKTDRKCRNIVGMFIEVVGDRPLGTYGKSDGREFRAVLDGLPMRRKHVLLTRNLSVSAAVAAAAKNRLPLISEKTVNQHLIYVQTVFNWVERRYDAGDLPLSVQITGPFLVKEPRATTVRKPFALDDLNIIFSSPVYTGCKSEDRWTEPGETVLDDTALYWLPLLALFTGARLQELAQLYVIDVRSARLDDGDTIYYLSFNDDSADPMHPDKRLKNNSSRRDVPIHAELIRCGFVEFVERKRFLGSLRLFPEIKASAVDGRYSSAFTATFRAFRFKIGLTDKAKPFHSFRHTFEDLMRHSVQSDDLRRVLTGRTEIGSSGGYGRGFSLERRNAAIQSIRIPKLDLSHLYER